MPVEPAFHEHELEPLECELPRPLVRVVGVYLEYLLLATVALVHLPDVFWQHHRVVFVEPKQDRDVTVAAQDLGIVDLEDVKA